MNRVLDFVRGRLAGLPDATDHALLARFREHRDDAAFAEVVRRHAPLVWGVCRRKLARAHDAEDAFQASFLVLVRRSAALHPDAPLGPWLHRVAVLTARNVVRGNRRRAAVSAPLEHDAAAPSPADSDFDLDAALLALPERERAAVVLCHLQGFTRSEAAARLRCPEGTLSARLSRALRRLRLKFGAPAVAVPVGLTAATVRAACSTSTITNGVLGMFGLKTLMIAAVLTGGGLVAGFASAQKDPSPVSKPLAADPLSDPDAEAKRLAEKIAALQQELKAAQLEAEKLAALKELRRKAEQDIAKAQADATLIQLNVRFGVVKVGEEARPSYEIRELLAGKVGDTTCYDIGVLQTFLTRAFNDPKGPRTITIHAEKDLPAKHLDEVFAACGKAGFAKATFVQLGAKFWAGVGVRGFEFSDPKPAQAEIDLEKYRWPEWVDRSKLKK